MLAVTPQACESGRPESNGLTRGGSPALCLLSYVRVKARPAGLEPANLRRRRAALSSTELRA